VFEEGQPAAPLYVLDHAEIARLYQRHLEVYTFLVLNVARDRGSRDGS
jgi:hypothetical protein